MTSQYAVTEEFTNFARSCRINIDVFGDVFWKVAIHHIPANLLVSKIQTFLQSRPVQQFKPFHHQLNNLCQLGRDPEKTDCDISILYSIIRNVCGLSPPSAGWGNPPTLNATSWTDDLESLREARNKLYAHATLASMTKQVYDNFVQRFKAILGRFDVRLGTTFSQRLDTIVTESLDPATYALYKRYVDELLLQKQQEVKLDKLVGQLEADVNIVKDSVKKLQSSCQSDRDRFQKDIEELKHKQDEERNRLQILMEESMTKKFQTLNNDIEMHIEQIKKTQQTDAQHTDKKQDLQALELKHTAKKQEALEGRVDQIERKVESAGNPSGSQSCRVDQIERKVESAGSPSGSQSSDEIKAYLLKFYQWLMPKHEMPAWCGVTCPFKLFTPISVREDLEYRCVSHHLQAMFPGPYDRETSGSRSRKPITSYREIFYKDDTPQRDIFMLGEAGVGKSTFCYHLVHLWCMLQSQTALPPMSDQDKDLIPVLSEFSFLFLIRCRDVNRNDADLSAKPTKSVLQMIKQLCPNSPHEKIVEIFNVFKGKCLVIIDGLDEWVYSASEESGTLSPQGLPDCKDVYGSTVLMTSRPWRVEALAQGLAPFCRVLQIDGLEEDAVETLSCKILETMNLPTGEGEVKAVYDIFHQQLKQHKMEEIVKQPLMLYIILREWHSGNQTLHKSLSINYTGLIESVLNHSKEKMLQKSERKENKQPLPPCFQGRETCLKYISQIRKLASLAFDTLVRKGKEKSLVFTQKELVDHIGKDDLDVCLRLGILSESKASSASNVRLVTISFLHKSLQECLTSVHISEDTTGQCLTEFTSKLTSLSEIFDVGNILIFLFGMSPFKGQLVMKHVCGVVEHCPAVKAYRHGVGITSREGENYCVIVKLIQQLYIRCIVEQEHSGMCPSKQDTTEACGYCIPDIVIYKGTPTAMIQHLCRPGKHIKSIVYRNIETPAFIIQSLNTTLKHIEKLCVTVSAGNAEKYIQQLCQSFSSLKQLQSFQLCVTSVYPLSLSQATYLFTELGKLPSLMSLELFNIDLTAMGNCEFPKNLTSLVLANVNVSTNLVVPQCCTRVFLHNVTVPGQVYISPVCSKLAMWGMSISDMSTLPNSLVILCMLEVTLSPAALHPLYTFINTTSGLQRLFLSPPAGSRMSLCEQVDLTSHLSLHRLVLKRLNMEGCVIVLPQNVREIGMVDVSMSGEHWYQVVVNMSSCHNVDMKFNGIRTLDQRTVEFIRQHLQVTQDKTYNNGYRTIHFHTKLQTDLTQKLT